MCSVKYKIYTYCNYIYTKNELMNANREIYQAISIWGTRCNRAWTCVLSLSNKTNSLLNDAVSWFGFMLSTLRHLNWKSSRFYSRFYLLSVQIFKAMEQDDIITFPECLNLTSHFWIIILFGLWDDGYKGYLRGRDNDLSWPLLQWDHSP